MVNVAGATLARMKAPEKPSAPENPPFQFLSHAEFAVLSGDEKLKYLASATRVVSQKIDDVLGESGPKAPHAG